MQTFTRGKCLTFHCAICLITRGYAFGCAFSDRNWNWLGWSPMWGFFYDETSWIPSANLTWLTVDNHHVEKVTIFSGYVSLLESSCFVETVLPNRRWTWSFAANIFRLAVLCRSCVDPIVFMSKGMTASPQKPIKLDRFTTTSRRDVTWFMVL